MLKYSKPEYFKGQGQPGQGHGGGGEMQDNDLTLLPATDAEEDAANKQVVEFSPKVPFASEVRNRMRFS